jgi:hypothetical protein
LVEAGLASPEGESTTRASPDGRLRLSVAGGGELTTSRELKRWTGSTLVSIGSTSKSEYLVRPSHFALSIPLFLPDCADQSNLHAFSRHQDYFASPKLRYSSYSALSYGSASPTPTYLMSAGALSPSRRASLLALPQWEKVIFSSDPRPHRPSTRPVSSRSVWLVESRSSTPACSKT